MSAIILYFNVAHTRFVIKYKWVLQSFNTALCSVRMRLGILAKIIAHLQA